MSKRRSILKLHEKTSEELLNEIDQLSDASSPEAIRKSGSWRRAVAEELKCLDENQDGLEARIISIEDDVQNQNTLQNNMQINQDSLKESLTLLEGLINKKLEEAKAEWQQEIQTLKNEIESLKAENKTLNDLVKENEDIMSNIRHQEIAELDVAIRNNEDAMRSLQEQVENSTMNQTGNSNIVASGDATKKLNLRIPKFKGTSEERPIKFLNDLKRYIEVTKLDEKEIRYVFSQSLEGIAQSWFNLNEKEILSIDDFEKEFKLQFWNDNTQRVIKRKIEFGKYHSKKNATRLAYAMDLFNSAQELDEHRDDCEIINQLSGHFEREIRSGIRVQRIKDKSVFFALLSEFDLDDQNQEDKPESIEKDKNYPNKNNNYYNNNYNKNRNNYNNKPRNEYEVNEVRMQRENKSKDAHAKKKLTKQQDFVNKAGKIYEKEVDVTDLFPEAGISKQGNDQ